MKNLKQSRSRIPIEKSTEDIDLLIERLNESLKPGQFFFAPGISHVSANKLTKQELIDEREHLLFTYKLLNNQFIYELLNRIRHERPKLNRTGALAALGIKDLTYRRWIRLAMLRINEIPNTERMPHTKLAAIPGRYIEPPSNQGDKTIERIKLHLIAVVEDHIRCQLKEYQRGIVLRMTSKSIRNMLKNMN